jgi:threonine/homoserine/homoserine lactone efflux protein
VLAALVLAIETGWYALVATLLSADRPRRAYVRYKAAIDRMAGAAMIALGLKLVYGVRN